MTKNSNIQPTERDLNGAWDKGTAGDRYKVNPTEEQKRNRYNRVLMHMSSHWNGVLVLLILLFTAGVGLLTVDKDITRYTWHIAGLLTVICALALYFLYRMHEYANEVNEGAGVEIKDTPRSYVAGSFVIPIVWAFDMLVLFW